MTLFSIVVSRNCWDSAFGTPRGTFSPLRVARLPYTASSPAGSAAAWSSCRRQARIRHWTCSTLAALADTELSRQWKAKQQQRSQSCLMERQPLSCSSAWHIDTTVLVGKLSSLPETAHQQLSKKKLLSIRPLQIPSPPKSVIHPPFKEGVVFCCVSPQLQHWQVGR